MRNFSHSKMLFDKAQKLLPGGVDSPVRSFKAVGGIPPFIEKGKGTRIWDADGNEYLDYVNSWGPLILGHAHPAIVSALHQAANNGTSFGAPTKLEVTLAEMISAALPSMEMVRFVNSGTEATMTALRLARAYTGREKIIKFTGGYHGHADSLLVKGGSGLATMGIPDSRGVPRSFVRNTLSARYNDVENVAALFARYPSDIAAVIVEPVAANMGVVKPSEGFLANIRRISDEHKALLIFDEVITGFRLAYGGAQSVNKIKPDLTCLGKIIGGGLPVGAYGGRADIMQMMAPAGPVYQAGTLSGNPLAMTAGIETLKILKEPGTYTRLENLTSTLHRGITAAANKAGVKVNITQSGSLLTVFFTGTPVFDFASAQRSDTERFRRFFHGLLENGIYWPPSQFEAAFISLAQSDTDISTTIGVIDKVMDSLQVNAGKVKDVS